MWHVYILQLLTPATMLCFDLQPDINEKMRAILIDWLVEVHLKFKVCRPMVQGCYTCCSSPPQIHANHKAVFGTPKVVK